MRRLSANPDVARLFAGRLVTNRGDAVCGVAAMWPGSLRRMPTATVVGTDQTDAAPPTATNAH